MLMQRIARMAGVLDALRIARFRRKPTSGLLHPRRTSLVAAHGMLDEEYGEPATPGTEAPPARTCGCCRRTQWSDRPYRRYRTPFCRAFVRSFLVTLLSVLLSALAAVALGYGLFVWMGKSTFLSADVADNRTVPAQPVLLAPTGAFGSQQKLVELPRAAAAAPVQPSLPPQQTVQAKENAQVDETTQAASQPDDAQKDEAKQDQ